MTYERGQYDDGYGRDRRPRRDASQRDEHRTGSGSSRYSRSSERYARHSSAQRDEGRPTRSQSRAGRQRRDDVHQSQRSRQRSRQDDCRNQERDGQRSAARSRQRDGVRDERRDPRGRQPQDTRSRQRSASRNGQRNVAQANQYSRDRYTSRSGQKRGASVSQQNFDHARRAKPIDPRAILALAIVTVILAAVIIVRFIAFGGVASEYGAAKAAIDQQQTQLTELETSNGELQAEMDSMQGLIDRYNNSGKK